MTGTKKNPKTPPSRFYSWAAASLPIFPSIWGTFVPLRSADDGDDDTTTIRLPPGVPHDFYAQAAAVAKRLGARFFLDTSGEPLVEALKHGVTLIKPNLREMQTLAGRPPFTGDSPVSIEDEAAELAHDGGLAIDDRRVSVLTGYEVVRNDVAVPLADIEVRVVTDDLANFIESEVFRELVVQRHE